ncbi:MAG: FKBP-type peptidyl-prolyl cis-trans isomerase [Alphaproteobacteria bacterium]|jgi:FKBP-type peptidyl-prolyl cis-trans isomerase|nr:FKBP-type peptidyl-prolyl cis-trans isomerase [Alphaproteobacteria bacterium]
MRALLAAAMTAMMAGCASGGDDGPVRRSAAEPMGASTGLVDRAPIRALTAEQNRARSAAFMAANASRPGVVSSPSGLQYRIERPVAADIPRPSASDRVRVHYEGRLLDGQVFDSSFERGEPVEFPLSGVIGAWREGLQYVKPGEVVTIWAPAELAYGARGSGNGEIPPFSALIFRVELLAFQRPDGAVVSPP